MSISNRIRVLGLAAPLAIAFRRPANARQDTAPNGLWPSNGWPAGLPEDQGFPGDLAEQIDAQAAAQTPLLSSLLVIRGGQLVAERYYNGFAAGETFLIWSIAKSVTTIGVGIAFREGLLSSLDQSLGELIPDQIPADADPRVSGITLEHLLTSTTGWAWDGRINFSRHDETDQLDLMMARPMVCDPGDCFEYDSTNTNLLSAIIQAVSGEKMVEYMRPRLFRPLGIPKPQWETTVYGATRGAGGLEMTPANVAKLGYLYLRGGEWDGERIVDEEWVSASTVEHASGSSSISGVNIGGGAYGYQWWIGEPFGYHAFYGNGYGGQTLYMVPELDLIVVTAVAGTDVDEPQNQQPVLPLIEWIVGLAEANS